MGPMRYASTDPKGAPAPVNPEATLGEAVAEMVREAARFFESQARGEVRGVVPKVPAWITFSMSGPRNARVKWRSPAHGPPRDHLYVPKGTYSDNHVVMRETTISQHLIYAAGELAADTLARRSGDSALLAFLSQRRMTDGSRG